MGGTAIEPSHARVNITAIDRHAGERDLLDMPVVGAAAAAEHAEMPELPAQRAIAPAKIGRIAGVEIGRGIELGVAARRCVRTQAAQARGPGLTLCFAL